MPLIKGSTRSFHLECLKHKEKEKNRRWLWNLKNVMWQPVSCVKAAPSRFGVAGHHSGLNPYERKLWRGLPRGPACSPAHPPSWVGVNSTSQAGDTSHCQSGSRLFSSQLANRFLVFYLFYSSQHEWGFIRCFLRLCWVDCWFISFKYLMKMVL